MYHLTIAVDKADTTESCALCGKRSLKKSGLTLCLEHDRHVCRDCGKRLAPSLVALVDLACTAQRVGKIGRHTLVPPLEALLDLARMAEEFLSSSPQDMRKAA